MQKENEISKINKGSVIGLGLCVAFLLFVVSYWIAAVIGFVQTESISISTAIGKVLSDPFAKYFNDYTPILMALSLIISEFVFYLLISKLSRNEKNVMEDEPIDILEKKDDENEHLDDISLFQEVMEKHSNNDNYIDDENSDIMRNFEIVLPEVLDTNGTNENMDVELTEAEQLEEKVEAEVEYSSEIAAELMSEYELDQIYAMLHITRYIDDVTTEMLRTMFKPTMSAEEIKDYIEIFYG